MITVSEKNNNSIGKNSADDPLDELNELDDKVPTIEPENDIFEELETRDADSIPVYDGKAGAVVDPIDAIIDEKEKNVEATKKAQEAKKQESELNQMKEVIEELESKEDKDEDNNIESQHDKTDDSIKENVNNQEVKTQSSNNKSSSSKKTKRAVPKPKPRKDKKTDNVKKIDDVKVDEDGVPLLNQFDTEKIKENSLYNKLHLSKRNITQIIMVIIGFIILIYGILQSFNDMVKISDNVIYGEHASMAIAIMFLGVLIIILSFYKEIIGILGIGGLYNNVDSTDDDTIDSYNDKE